MCERGGSRRVPRYFNNLGWSLARNAVGEYKANMASPMPHVRQLQSEIEGALARKFVGALSVRPRGEGQKHPTGIAAVDALLAGGFPVGGLSELVGAQSSGRTTLAMSLLAKTTSEDTAAAWIDVSDAFDTESAAQCGVDLRRLLWVRCADLLALTPPAVPQPSLNSESGRDVAAQQNVPRGGGSPHPRSEAHGMPHAVASLLQAQPRSAAIQDRRARRAIGTPGAPNRPVAQFPLALALSRRADTHRPYAGKAKCRGGTSKG